MFLKCHHDHVAAVESHRKILYLLQDDKIFARDSL